MQFSLKCGHCGFQYLSENEEDLAVEIDFVAKELRYLCRKCRKENVMEMASKKSKRLPAIGATRF